MPGNSPSSKAIYVVGPGFTRVSKARGFLHEAVPSSAKLALHTFMAPQAVRGLTPEAAGLWLAVGGLVEPIRGRVERTSETIRALEVGWGAIGLGMIQLDQIRDIYMGLSRTLQKTLVVFRFSPGHRSDRSDQNATFRSIRETTASRKSTDVQQATQASPMA